MSQVSFSDTELGTDVWPRLKAFILECDESASKHVLFMCNYCKQSIKMPPRCVLNGLETVEIKAPLAKLDRLSRQLIQRAKCYQTVDTQSPCIQLSESLQRDNVLFATAVQQHC